MSDSLVVVSPANGNWVGQVAMTPAGDVPEVVRRARAAQPAWAARPLAERVAVLRRVRQKVLDASERIVELVAKENGKPKHEGLLHEVMAPLELLTYFTDAAPRILEPQNIPMRLMVNRASYIHYVPRGVIGVIGPWNFPHHTPFGGVVMALLGGNAVVLKPSEFTPLIAQLVHGLYLEAGVPADVFQVVYGLGDVGAALIAGGVDMIEFTGSVATGRKVGVACAERMIPCVLELGGKAPALVLPDADLTRTANAITWGGWANAGQVCASIERLLVHEAVYERLVPMVVERARALRVGDAAESADIDIGPLVNERQLRIVEARVADAVAKGATVACGGHRLQRPGNFYAPTVLLDVTPDMDVLNEETFGPVVPVQKIKDEAAMIAEANRSHLGLLAYVFSRDGARARSVAERLEVGTVMINDVIVTNAMAETPWGGLKQSGIGVTHSDDGMRAMCQARHVNYDLLPWLSKEPWWYPYRASDLPLLQRGLRLLYGRGLAKVFSR